MGIFKLQYINQWVIFLQEHSFCTALRQIQPTSNISPTLKCLESFPIRSKRYTCMTVLSVLMLYILEVLCHTKGYRKKKEKFRLITNGNVSVGWSPIFDRPAEFLLALATGCPLILIPVHTPLPFYYTNGWLHTKTRFHGLQHQRNILNSQYYAFSCTTRNVCITKYAHLYK